MTTHFRLAALLLACSLVTGCATAFRGDKQTVKFVSQPTAAAVSLNGQPAQTTPFSATLKRNATQHVLATAPGYRPIRFDMSAQRDMAAVPQLIVPGGSALMATDVATGADRTYPGTVTIKFTEPAAAATQPAEMYEFHGAVLTKPDYDEAVEAYKQALYNNRPENAKHPEQRRQ